MTTDTHDAPPHGHGGSIPLIIGSIGTLLLLAALDQTIVSTALPTIVSDLGGLDHLSWVVTAYILSSTVVAPLYGKIGDLYGRRNTVFVSVGLFLVGSMLCGMADSMTFLIVSRAIQGFGGGGLFVLALSIIGEVIPPRDRGKVQGIFAAVFSMSSVVGPMIGGWFVEAFSWHWIFYINIPFGIGAIVAFSAGFKPTGRRVSHSIDWLGAITLSIALTAITLLTALGGRSFEWQSVETYGLAAITLIFGLAFVRIESRAKEPILPLGLFKMNIFWVTSVVGFIVGAAMFGSVTFLPIYLQIAKGIAPTESGLLLVPMTFGILTASIISGRYMAKTGKYKILPILGNIFIIVGMFLMTRLTADTSRVTFSIYLAIFGFGPGFIFPVVTTAVQNAVAKEVLGTATAAGLLFRQVGGSLAVAVFGALFASRMADSMGGAGGNMTMGGELSPAAMAHLPENVRAMIGEAVVNAMHPNFLIALGLGVIGIIFSLILEEKHLVNRQVDKGLSE